MLGRQHSSRAAAALRPQSALWPSSLAEPDGLSGLTTQDHHQPNDHGAWSLPPGPAPWSGITSTTCPNAPAGGLVSTRSFSCSPANRPAPWRWTSSLVGQAARRRPSLCACDTAAQIRHRPSCEPPTANAAPSLPSDPMRAGDHAARGPRRHVEPIAPTGAARPPSHSTGQRGSDSAAAEPRTPETRPSGHTCMAPDAWTPDAWTPDVRLTDWTRTSAQRTEHADRATTGVAGVRTSSRPATNRWAARPRPGRSVWWRSASHNGSA